MPPADLMVTYRSALDIVAASEPVVAAAIAEELIAQRRQLKLIAAENYASPAVLLAMGNWLSDKYAEGFSGHRLYGRVLRTHDSDDTVNPHHDTIITGGAKNVTIERLVGRFYDQLWNAWDDAAVEQVLAPEFMFRGSMGTETSGVAGWRSYREAIREASPDFHNEIVDLVFAGERAAARLRYTGTHAGTLAGVPATGRRFEYVGAAFFASVEGKLTSAWVLGDLDGLRRQLH